MNLSTSTLPHTSATSLLTRYYAASLCLFRWSVTGQLPSSGCAATGGIETTHKDYGNAAGTRGMSAEELSLIAQAARSGIRAPQTIL